MSQVRKPRKRPRVESVSTYSLGWLIPRVAWWTVHLPGESPADRPKLAQWVATASLHRLKLGVSEHLARYPHRRYKP